MIIIKPGSVLLVPYPFTNLTTIKKRPAVVISAPWYIADKSDVILVPVTSSIQTPIDPNDILIQGADIQLAGLDKESLVVTTKIFTISKDRIYHSLGMLNRGLFEKVLNGVKHCLAT